MHSQNTHSNDTKVICHSFFSYFRKKPQSLSKQLSRLLCILLQVARTGAIEYRQLLCSIFLLSLFLQLCICPWSWSRFLTFDSFGKHSSCELNESVKLYFWCEHFQKSPSSFAAIWYIASLFGADTCVQLIPI